MSPLTAESLPEIKAVTDVLQQGDLITLPYLPTLETPEYTFDPEVEPLKPIGGQDVWAVPARQVLSGLGAIVTQTCDIVRSALDEPVVQVVPLLELADQESWRAGLGGRSSSVFALRTPETLEDPSRFYGFTARESASVSKAALLHPEVLVHASPLDPAERIALSTWLARRVARHPFPDPVEDLVLRPLRAEIVRRAKKPTTQTGALVESLLGVWCTPTEAPTIEVRFVVSGSRLLARSTALPNEEVIEKQAEVLLKPAHKRISTTGAGVSLDSSVVTLTGVSAHDLLVRLRQVDMDLLPHDAYVGAASAEMAIGAQSAS